jgi:hypothetical protein
VRRTEREEQKEARAGDYVPDDSPETAKDTRVTIETSKAEDALTQVVTADAEAEFEDKAVSVEQRAKNVIGLLDAYQATAQRKGYPQVNTYAYKYIGDWKGRAPSLSDLRDFYNQVDIAIANATRPGVGGLSFALGLEQEIKEYLSMLNLPKWLIDDAWRYRAQGNPFGAFAGLYIKRKQFLNRDGKYDSARVRAFKKNYAKYMPALVLWDQLLRLVADVYQPERQFYPGFVLDDDVIAMYVPSIASIMVNPFFFKNAKSSYNNAQDLAAYLHGLICHEMAHMVRGLSHGDGHDEKFSIIREDIASKTYPLLPAFARLISEVLDMPLGFMAAGAKEAATAKVTKSCPQCYAQLIETLEQDGRLDTIEWLKRA